MFKEKMLTRTSEFGYQVFLAVKQIKDTRMSQSIINQIVRSTFSIGANYRAACLSKSRKDFINKLKIVEDETDETIYWLSIILRLELLPVDSVGPLIREGKELMAIFVKSIKTAKGL